jgi:acetyl-CoA C-acetyltransferase
MTVPALTVNKVCLSGSNAIATAAMYVELGLAGLLAAGGMESMSGAPYLLPKARWGARMGDAELVDSMIHDGLWDAFQHVHMGGLSDEVNARLGIDRAVQDEWAARSHERAATAAKGALREEITPVRVPRPKDEPILVDQDEGVRPGTTPEALARLRPSFAADGTITAGNASQLSDGAAAVVVTSAERAAAEGLPVLASIVAYGTVAGPDPSLHSQPSRAIQDACDRAGVAVGDLDLVEINEAFAGVAVQSTRDLHLDPAIVNVNGGAVALGHPIGASGARLALTLALELRRRGGGLGAAALCGGGGQGDALLLRVAAG